MANEVGAQRWFGIDLGTTNSVAAVMRNGHPEVLCNSHGDSLNPSCVYFNPNSDEILFGIRATAKKAAKPENTVFDAKRLVGMPFKDDNVQKFIKSVNFAVVPASDRPHIKLQHNGKMELISPEEVGSHVLRKLKQLAENNMSSGAPVELANVVITHPATFGMQQRMATIQAAKKASFNKVQLLSEPAAAAYAYGFQHSRFDGYKLLAYDFGGGTFDLSIVFVEDGDFEVKSIGGDKFLGGREIDLALRKKCIEMIKSEFGEGKMNEADKQGMQILLEKCEQVKKELSDAESAESEIYLDFIRIYDYLPVGRALLEEVAQPILLKSIELVKNALSAIGLTVDDIDVVLLVGGVSNMPLVAKLLESKCGIPQEKLNKSVNPMHAVAKGAAILAAQMDNSDNNLMPSMKLVEAIPLSIGINVQENTFFKLIPRNSSIPCSFQKNFCTPYNDQSAIGFDVFEGERKIAKKNNFLGKFSIGGLPKGVAGSVSVTLSMEVDQNGILHAIATHKEMTAALDVEYNNIRTDMKNAGEMILTAKLHSAEDGRENSREAVKYELIHAMEVAKYNCTNISVLNLCREYKEWLNKNKKAAIDVLRKKLEAFETGMKRLS